MSWEDGSAGKETATNGWSLVTPWLAHAAVGLRWPGNEERTDAHRKATIRIPFLLKPTYKPHSRALEQYKACPIKVWKTKTKRRS